MFDNVLISIFNRVEDHYLIKLGDVAKWNISWAYDFLRNFNNFSVDFFVESVIGAVELLFEPVNSVCEEEIVMCFVSGCDLSPIESLEVMQFFDNYDWDSADVFKLIDNDTCKLVDKLNIYDIVCSCASLDGIIEYV